MECKAFRCNVDVAFLNRKRNQAYQYNPGLGRQRDESYILECKSSFVNKLSLYTLSPGVTSTFKDVKVCKELCDFPDQDEGLQKLYQGDNKSATLVNPFQIFSMNGADNLYTCFLILNILGLLTYAF